MVNRRASDAAPPATAIAPVVKRKRRASCLGEQERRERKRAIDREAQRSLREKTKTHIAELERTIQILRDQDRNGATASLLSEIDGLRAENERLRDVIDSVKSVVGSEIFPRTAPAPAAGSSSNANANGATNPNGNANATRSYPGSPSAMANGEGQAAHPHHSQSPRRTRTDSMVLDHKPALLTPTSGISEPLGNPFDPMRHFGHHLPTSSGPVDLDGMTVMTSLPGIEQSHSAATDLGLSLDLPPVFEMPETDVAVTQPPSTAIQHHSHTHTSSPSEDNLPDAPDSPTTAAFAPFIHEIFGQDWRCTSPVVLHIGEPARPLPSSSSSMTSNALCPIWKKSNELFGKVFSYHTRPGMATPLSADMEAGLLYVGIDQGWHTFNEWMQSPALKILKEVDELLFCRRPKMDRLATAYKSYKLLRYYLNATKNVLEDVPDWLRPSLSQARTKHPVALDFFPWPTVRDRLVAHHNEIFQTTDLSHSYSQYLSFEWPFSFEDTFFFDEGRGAYVPSPLFERYHRDLKYWTVSHGFYKKFPEMRGDIEGDRRRFCEVDV